MKEKLLSIALALVVSAANVNAETQMTVNGRPATKQEKAVAAKMVKQGVQMAKKGAGLAVTAVANPTKAEAIQEELEKMGEEMERLGDSLEALTEDTTFLYSEADSLELEGDSLELSGDDLDDIVRGFEDGLGINLPNTWWDKTLLGIFGIFFGVLSILFVILIFVLIFGLVTAPFWIIALVIWALTRNSKKTVSQEYMRYQTPHPGQQKAQTAQTAQPAAEQQGQTNGQSTQSESTTATGAKLNDQPEYMTSEYNTTVTDDRSDMWHSGIMYCCVGLGLVLLFYSIGFEGLWGVGALVACIGIAKLVIASIHK